MKQTLLFAALGLTALGAAAQEVGTVISSTPVVQQIAVARQICNNQPVMVQPQTSGGGGLLGALAGAAIGSQIGGGNGRAAALGIGAIGGALLGNSIEANGNAQAQMVPQCATQTVYENRTVAWNVTYEYAGRQQTVQMPYDPGPTIRLQVTPVGMTDPYAAPMAQGYAPGYPNYASPQTAVGTVVYHSYAAYPAYPAYGAYPYPAYPAYPYPVYRAYPPVGVSLGFVFGGHRHRHHRWR